jgi:AbrB family looped-hinge helix DNA binding protein
MIHEERKIGPKGQVVVPGVFRKALGIKPGSLLRFRLEGNKLILEKIESDAVAQFERVARAGTSIRKIGAHEYEEELERRASR